MPSPLDALTGILNLPKGFLDALYPAFLYQQNPPKLDRTPPEVTPGAPQPQQAPNPLSQMLPPDLMGAMNMPQPPDMSQLGGQLGGLAGGLAGGLGGGMPGGGLPGLPGAGAGGPGGLPGGGQMPMGLPAPGGLPGAGGAGTPPDLSKLLPLLMMLQQRGGQGPGPMGMPGLPIPPLPNRRR